MAESKFNLSLPNKQVVQGEFIFVSWTEYLGIGGLAFKVEVDFEPVWHFFASCQV